MNKTNANKFNHPICYSEKKIDKKEDLHVYLIMKAYSDTFYVPQFVAILIIIPGHQFCFSWKIAFFR